MSGKILIVDDESDIRNLLEEILSEEGYEVVSAADAAEARTDRKPVPRHRRGSRDHCLRRRSKPMQDASARCCTT